MLEHDLGHRKVPTKLPTVDALRMIGVPMRRIFAQRRIAA